MNKPTQSSPDLDPTASSRKSDHIALAFESQVQAAALDSRFYYEPMLAAHPLPGVWPAFPFLDSVFQTPLWVSSMTGGTALASTINHNLARAAAEFGFGMGLGSCRQLLYSAEHLSDFDVRDTLGADRPLYANLGVAQVERLLADGEGERMPELVALLRANGLILHVNPLQEAMQPEGDRFVRPPVEVVQEVVETFDFPVIVKEVGQGFGPASLRALLQMPLAAIEFAAGGGTNFAKLELLRSTPAQQEMLGAIAAVGHSAAEMTDWTNQLVAELGDRVQTRHLIISGGIQTFLDGYWLVERSSLPAVYGQASAFLRHARGEYDELRTFVESQINGLALAKAFLTIRNAE
jgi:isopentenyl-diphosphate delta-isomerase